MFPATQKVALVTLKPRALRLHLPRQMSLNMSTETKPPLPPYTKESAIQKIRMAEDAWNSQDPDRVKMAYTPDSVWRNRNIFLRGRDEIRQFLDGKWDREQEYRLIKELWSYSENRIAVRFCYEYHDAGGQWFRAHGKKLRTALLT